MWLFIIFMFKKSKSHDLCWKKNINFNKNETKSKIIIKKISHTVLERWTMCFSSYKNCELELKLWWVEACKRKMSAFFVMFILSEGNFFNLYFISMYNLFNKLSEYIYFYIYTFTDFCCLFLKLSKAFSVTLRSWISL